MAAANTDKLRKLKNTFSTTLSSGVTDSDTTIPLNSASGLPTDTAITLCIDRVDANGASTPSTKEFVTGVISGNNLTNALRGEGSSTAQAHDAGAVVECIWDAETWNDAVDWGLVGHNQDGTHKSGSVLTLPQINDTTSDHQYVFAVSELEADRTVTLPLLTGNDEFVFKDHTQTLTNKTLTSPKIGTAITDTNGNEVIKTPATGSAVNEITVTNAATGNAPQISATGGDDNIDLKLVPKGTGEVKYRKSIIVQVVDGATDLTTGDGKAYLTIPEQLNGMNLSAVHARVITAPVGATVSIQIHNVTDAADMLSTALTIDATETGSDSAATPAVINTSADDVVTNDLLRIDIDQVGSSTAGAGLIVRLEFDLA